METRGFHDIMTHVKKHEEKEEKDDTGNHETWTNRL